jgi:diguanylate cyclase (GGDEF)-like protein
MKDTEKTEKQLLEENHRLLRRISELEKLLSKQKQLEAQLRTMSLTDDLTGLYNRRGFFTLAEQQLKMAKRLKRGVLLLYADIDNLKTINDTYGHSKGASAIIDTANILKSTYRESDIIARIGGDEFVAFPVGALEDNAEAITTRLKNNIDAHNKKNNRPYKLSVSIGIKECVPQSPYTLEDLINEADQLMYKQKKSKKN